MTAATAPPAPTDPSPRPAARSGPAGPPRPTRPDRPAHLGAAEGFLALVTLAVIVGFSRIFTGASYAVPLIVVGGATHLWLALARRRRVHLGLAAMGTALGFVVLATWLLFHESAWLGLPTGATAQAARNSVVTSWHAFQTVVAPTTPQSGFMLGAALAVCFAVFLADWAAFRLWSPIEALVPTLTLAGFTIFVGSSRGQILTTMLYVAAAMAVRPRAPRGPARAHHHLAGQPGGARLVLARARRRGRHHRLGPGRRRSWPPTSPAPANPGSSTGTAARAGAATASPSVRWWTSRAS